MPRYLLYRALGALVPYIVGTWEVRVFLLMPRYAAEQRLALQCAAELRRLRVLWFSGGE